MSEIHAVTVGAQGCPDSVNVKKPKRSLWDKFMLSVTLLTAFGCAAAGFVLMTLNDETSNLQRISVNTVEGKSVLTKVEEPLVEPVNILVLGVDNAEGLDPGDPVTQGRNTTSMLSDVIMIVRLDPQTKRVSVLSIPRDWWVTIGPFGQQGKINSAVPYGGPALLIETLERELGIPINHFMQVNFAGFQKTIETLGGVPLVFDYPVRDANSGLSIEDPGCFVLDGKQSLSFVRSRYYEAFVDGQWISDPRGDRGRVERQQVFIRALFEAGVRQGARNPFQFQRMFDALKEEVIFDDTLQVGYLLEAGNQLRDIGLSNLAVVTLPTENGWVGDAAVVFLLPAELPAALAEFQGTQPAPPVAPVETPAAPQEITSPEVSEGDIFLPRSPTTEVCV